MLLHGPKASGRVVRIASVSLALTAVVALGAAARAATVKAVEGQVLVNSGQGFRLVDGSTPLEPGGTVVANPGAVAQVVYAGGCTVTVQPGSVYLTAAQAPCQTGEPTRTGGLTDRGGADKGGQSDDKAGQSGGSGTTWAIVGAAVVAGGVGGYFLMDALSP